MQGCLADCHISRPPGRVGGRQRFANAPRLRLVVGPACTVEPTFRKTVPPLRGLRGPLCHRGKSNRVLHRGSSAPFPNPKRGLHMLRARRGCDTSLVLASGSCADAHRRGPPARTTAGVSCTGDGGVTSVWTCTVSIIRWAGILQAAEGGLAREGRRLGPPPPSHCDGRKRIRGNLFR